MKTRFLAILATIAAFLTVLGGLDLSGILPLLPDKVATGLVTALPLLAGIKHLLDSLGDFADDGQINGSWKAKCFPVMLWLTLGTLALPLCSCAELAGTTLSFDEQGALVVTPPPRPIVIPLDGK